MTDHALKLLAGAEKVCSDCAGTGYVEADHE